MDRTIALLLAGGEGKRLGAMTYMRPKPIVPFGGNYKLIDFTLSNALNSSVERLGLLIQSNQDSIKNYVGNGKSWGFQKKGKEFLVLTPQSSYWNSPKYCGTAGAVRQNLDRIRNDPQCDTVLILSADHIYKMDYHKLIKYHRKSGADVTVATSYVPRKENHKFGIVHVDERNRVVNWEEKPRNSMKTDASMGIYVFSKKYLIHALEQNSGSDFGHHIMPFACQNATICSYRYSGYWRDVGTPDSYWRSNMDVLSSGSNIKLKDWNLKGNPTFDVRNRTIKRRYIASCAVVDNSIISDRCLIKGRVINSIIFPGVRIGKNAYVSNSVIMNDTVIAPNARIENSVVCHGVNIGRGALIGSTYSPITQVENIDLPNNGLVVVGENISIKSGECIHKNSMLFSHMQYREYSDASRMDGNSFIKRNLNRQVVLN